MLEEDSLINGNDNSARIEKLKKEVDARLRFGRFLELVMTDGENASEELAEIQRQLISE